MGSAGWPPYVRSHECSERPLRVGLDTQRRLFLTQIHEDFVLDGQAAFFVVSSYERLMTDANLASTVTLAFVHDWVRMTGYESTARRHLVSWGLRIRPHVERIDFCLSPSASTIVRMGASVVGASFSTLGIPVRAHFDGRLDRVLLDVARGHG